VIADATYLIGEALESLEVIHVIEARKAKSTYELLSEETRAADESKLRSAESMGGYSLRSARETLRLLARVAEIAPTAWLTPLLRERTAAALGR
jgi:hypothetical protein